jgi:hypothetical protein
MWADVLDNTKHDPTNDGDADWDSILSQSSYLNLNHVECFRVLHLQMCDQYLQKGEF